MNKRTFVVALIGLLVVLVAVSIVWAQTSTSFDLSWYVLAGGGSRADSAAYAMNGTVGQGIVGLSDSTSFQMQSGYWSNTPTPSATPTHTPTCTPTPTATPTSTPTGTPTPAGESVLPLIMKLRSTLDYRQD